MFLFCYCPCQRDVKIGLGQIERVRSGVSLPASLTGEACVSPWSACKRWKPGQMNASRGDRNLTVVCSKDVGERGTDSLVGLLLCSWG